jgi:hypothetical protein
MVSAGVGQLRKAFQRHRQTGVTQAEGRNLLLFYAVECGLKAAWLNRNKLRDTSAIDPVLKEKGHDLIYWTKQLRLPAVITNGKTNFRTRVDGTSRPLEAAHEVWRYGVDIDPADQTSLEIWLEQVWQWSKEELGL